MKLRKLVGMEIRMVGGGGGITFNCKYPQSTIKIIVGTYSYN